MSLIICSSDIKDMVKKNNKIIEDAIRDRENKLFFKNRIRYYKRVRAKALIRIKQINESIKIILDDNNQYLYPVVNNQDKLDENKIKFDKLNNLRDSFFKRAHIAEKTINFFKYCKY